MHANATVAAGSGDGLRRGEATCAIYAKIGVAWPPLWVDYYSLPQSGSGAWPGRAKASQRPFRDKAKLIEEALLEDIVREMGANFDSRRFIPFLIMHEYEALLFSDCSKFGNVVGWKVALQLQTIREFFGNPEKIDESPNQAPSKRIKGLYPRYQKPLLGTMGALEIGLPGIRERVRISPTG